MNRSTSQEAVRPLPPMDDPAVELEAVCKSHGRGTALVRVLQDLSLQVRRGEFVAVMGPSGSGKTSLLNLMGGLDRPDSGQVRVAGQALAGLSDRELADWRARRVGFIFQFYNLIPVLNALDNVALPLALTCPGAAVRRARAAAALELVGLAERMRHMPRQLSGGEQQRVAIARAVVTGPALLLCDEPTGDLDRAAGDQVLALLRLLQQRLHTTIVMVTHDPQAAAQADRIVRMDKGDKDHAAPAARPAPEAHHA
jgi:putative ABC transport system ATP-binding protein